MSASLTATDAMTAATTASNTLQVVGRANAPATSAAPNPSTVNQTTLATPAPR